MAFRPYLTFAGNARDAFTRYREIFGGDIVVLSMSDIPESEGAPPPGADPNMVMHAALTNGAELLMGAGAPTGDFDGNVRGLCVSWNAPDGGEAKRVFDALADGG